MGSSLEKHLVCCFHGFLGRPSDYDFLKNQMTLSADIEWFIPDLFDWGSQHNWPHLNNYGEVFNQTLQAQFPNSQNLFNKKIFVGYSMGGRLGLHLLRYQMEQIHNKLDFCFDAFIFISTGTGLVEDQDKISRIKDDKKWAQIFLEKPWEEALKLWNHQGVLQNSQEPMRLEKNYNKINLGQSFEVWGLAQQNSMVQVINHSKIPMLWLVGERDLKYQGIYTFLHDGPNLKKIKIPNSGHRVIFDEPLTVLQIIRDCIVQLEDC